MGNATELVELLAAVDEINPIIEKAMPSVTTMATLLKPLVEGICDLNVEMTHRMIRGYVDLGYEMPTAITLTMWNKQIMMSGGKGK